MKVKQNYTFSLPTPVEPAFEANEAAVHQNQSTSMHFNDNDNETPKLVKVPVGTIPPLQIIASIPRTNNNRDTVIRREFVQKLKNDNQNFEIQAKDDGFIMRSNDDCNEQKRLLMLKCDLDDATPRYEIPDMNLSQTAVRILGNRKELEMHEFSSKRLAAVSPVTDSKRKLKMPIIDPSGERESVD